MTYEIDRGPEPLPPLRQDLRLEPGPPTIAGGSTWLIADPITHRFFEIDIEAYQILSLWTTSPTIDDLKSAVLERFGRRIDTDDVLRFIGFLDHSGLVIETKGGWRAYAKRARRDRPGPLAWLIHNYLFIRVPLVRPEKALKATAPFVEMFYTRGCALAVLAVTLAGLYLASRQWTEFIGTFQHFYSLGGAVLFAVALAIVKTLHELGHAYTATRYGVRVPTMGVAFLVMVPMLYTDVTDAWRLKSKSQRMAIDAAGVIVELALAGLATFLWAFLPDGPARSLAFVLATTSWVTSLLINLSPLMRFDGYFLFADWVGVSNLQPRANALGRWKLREILFGLGEPNPDRLPKRTERWVIVYAWTIWIYRLVVFTGIALTVYHFFFKVLGVILFLVEIGWFIVKPVMVELQNWWARRGPIAHSRRARVTGAVALLALLALIVPWSGSIDVPAIREPAVYARLYPPAAARISKINVRQGQRLAAGDVVAELESPRLALQLMLTERRLALMRLRLNRRIADRKDKTETFAIEKEIALLSDKRAGLAKEISELIVRTPVAGDVAELNREAHPGRTLARGDEIALIVAPEHGSVLRGYLSEVDLARIAPGAQGQFRADDALWPATKVTVKDVAYSGAQSIDIPYLSSTLGGLVPARDDKDRGLVPAQAAYLVTMTPVAPTPPRAQVERGLARLEGTRESLLAGLWRQTLKVLVRESGA